MGQGGETTCVKSHYVENGQAGSWAPGSGRQTNVHLTATCCLPTPNMNWLPRAKPHSEQLHSLPWAPLGLARKSQFLIQGLKMPSTTECGLWVKTSLEKVGPDEHGVLCMGTSFVSQVALNDVSSGTRANTAMFSSFFFFFECNCKECGNIQEKWMVN